MISYQAYAACLRGRLNSNVRPQVSTTEINARLRRHFQAVRSVFRLASISRLQGPHPWFTSSVELRWHSQLGHIAALRQHCGSAFKTRVSTVEA